MPHKRFLFSSFYSYLQAFFSIRFYLYGGMIGFMGATFQGLSIHYEE